MTFYLAHVLFHSMLFDLQISLDFSLIFLLLMSSHILLLSQSRHGMISSILNMLKCV